MARRHLLQGALIAILAVVASVRFDASPRPTILIELFTSEGCSSCPPADRLLEQLANAPSFEGAAVIPLGEHVDYWDQLGWRDRFSSSALTNRQQLYTRNFGGDGPYTPQLVIDGRAECIGSDAASARRAIAKAASQPHGTIAIALAGSTGSGLHAIIDARDLPQKPTDRADLFVAITEDGLRSDVTRGENHGRTLVHAAVVRQLVKVGDAVGTSATAEHAVTLGADWRRDRMHVVAFVQERRNGAVLAAASVPLVPRP